MEQDWDNLLILDACRFDMYEEYSSIPGELRMVRSQGSKTGEFLKTNFDSDIFPDTIYVSANPQIQMHDIGRRFYESIPLWDTEWDDDLQTVPPERVAERAIEAERAHPNKRLIVHFVQPHYPFIGETGRRIRHGEMIGDGMIKEERSHPTIWDRLENGEISRDRVWKAYTENLELTLPHVQDLLNELTGKSVVTSDHGNALGEWGIYGHPAGVHIPSLVEVPWLMVDGEERKKVIEEKIETIDYHSEDTVDDRLKALGYRS